MAQRTSMEELVARVDDYVARGYYAHCAQVCGVALQQGYHIFPQFWHAYATDQQGNPTQAIREMKQLLSDRVAGFAATAALITIHKAQRNKDKEELKQLMGQLKEQSKGSDHESLVFAARYFHHSGKAKQARQCIEKVLKEDKKQPAAWNLYGLINLAVERFEMKALSNFENALKLCEEQRNLSAFLGRAAYFRRRGN